MPHLSKRAGRTILGLAVLAVAAYGLRGRDHPAPVAPVPAPPPPPAPRRRRRARRRLVAGLSLAALCFASAGLSAEPIVRERSVAPRLAPRPAPALAARPLPVLAARPLPMLAAVRLRPRRERRAHPPRVLPLTERVLRDPRIHIYAGGRADVSAGRVDPRVLEALLYLARRDHEVTVTSLISGHRLYARPGVVSAHVYGRAADIAALDGIPIAGNQGPGGITEDAVRDLLRLPARRRPRQVISLLALGGPSFALPDHADHIHIGY